MGGYCGSSRPFAAKADRAVAVKTTVLTSSVEVPCPSAGRTSDQTMCSICEHADTDTSTSILLVEVELTSI